MHVRTLVAWFVGAIALVALAGPAAACGFWRMTDAEKKLEIGWLVNSGSIKKGARRVGALYLDTESKHAPRVVAGKRVVLDVVDGRLRKRGKPIGAIAGNTITIGTRTYAIAFTDPSDYHGMAAWALTVTRGDDVIVTTAQAAALCAAAHRDPPMSEAAQQDEIRRRVAFYLAWRDVGL